MHDLFLRLGISTDASADEIAAAIESKPHLAGASEILLNPLRRAAYQRTVFTLRSIGELRHRLGLDSDASWFQETCGDFSAHAQARKFTAKADAGAEAGQPALAAGRPGTVSGPVTGRADTASAARSRSWLNPLLAVAVVVALLALVWLLR